MIIIIELTVNPPVYIHKSDVWLVSDVDYQEFWWVWQVGTLCTLNEDLYLHLAGEALLIVCVVYL